MSRSSSRRGSAIWLVFIAIALFGGLAYAFMRGTGGSTAMMQGEMAKANAVNAQDCSNNISTAVKRLTLRGCGTYISYNNDGSSNAEDGPTDGSCSVFHVNGGGVKPCSALAVAPTGCDVSATPGTVCPDGTIYVGRSPANNKRMFWQATAGSARPWNNGNTSGYTLMGASSRTNGKTNTALLTGDSDSVTAGTQIHQAPRICYFNSIGTYGYSDWYMPAIDEMKVIASNAASISSFDAAQRYCSSTEQDQTSYITINLQYTGTADAVLQKHFACMSRCVRTN